VPTHIPQHYNLQLMSIKDASLNLDMHHKQGWRVVQMTLHPNGETVLLLMEKTAVTAKN
jgi:hypothetical protein